MRSEIVLARRVGADGRTRAYLGGRSIQLSELRELAGELLSFYGQHEHRRLMLAAAQLEILDASAGAEQAVRRAACAGAWASGARGPRGARAPARARRRARAPARPARVRAGGDRGGRPRRGRARAAGRRARPPAQRRGVARGGVGSRAGALGGGHGGAARAARLRHEPRGRRLARRRAASARSPGACARDRGAGRAQRRPRAYGEGLESEPGRLEAVEERLAAIARLERKHGGTVAAVLEHAARCRERRDELLGAELAMEEASARLEAALGEHAAAHVALSCGAHSCRAAARGGRARAPGGARDGGDEL